MDYVTRKTPINSLQSEADKAIYAMHWPSFWFVRCGSGCCLKITWYGVKCENIQHIWGRRVFITDHIMRFRMQPETKVCAKCKCNDSHKTVATALFHTSLVFNRHFSTFPCLIAGAQPALECYVEIWVSVPTRFDNYFFSHFFQFFIPKNEIFNFFIIHNIIIWEKCIRKKLLREWNLANLFALVGTAAHLLCMETCVPILLIFTYHSSFSCVSVLCWTITISKNKTVVSTNDSVHVCWKSKKAM